MRIRPGPQSRLHVVSEPPPHHTDESAHIVAPVDDAAGAPIMESETRMSAANLMLVLFSVTIAAVGQLMLRHGMQGARLAVEDGHGSLARNALTSPYVFGGLAVFGVSALSWLVALSRVPLSRAYPFNALGYVGILAASAIFLHEEVTPLRWFGAGLVIVGLLLVVRS
jgi:drug/metabolite transporter (DMT)-like permease